MIVTLIIIILLTLYTGPVIISTYVWAKCNSYSKDDPSGKRWKRLVSYNAKPTNSDIFIFRLFTFIPLVNIIQLVMIIVLINEDWLKKEYTFKKDRDNTP